MLTPQPVPDTALAVLGEGSLEREPSAAGEGSRVGLEREPSAAGEGSRVGLEREPSAAGEGSRVGLEQEPSAAGEGSRVGHGEDIQVGLEQEEFVVRLVREQVARDGESAVIDTQ